MINVITTEPSIISHPFPGMSLAEACGTVDVFVTEMVNDLHMDILLSEHAFLYNNGCEMEYVDEAGNLNEAGKSLKKKIIDTITSVGKMIQALWDKLIETISNVLSDLKARIMRLGISKTDVNSVKSHAKEIFDKSDKSFEIEVGYTIDESFFGKNEYYNMMKTEAESTDDYSTADEIYNKYVKNGNATIYIDEATFNHAVDCVFGDMLKQIKEAKRTANEWNAEQIKLIRAAKGDYVDEQVSKLKGNMKTNVAITKGLIKVYNKYFNQAVSIVHTVLRHKSAVKFRKEDAKARRDAFKANPASTVAGYAAGAVSNVATRADNVIHGIKDKAEEAKNRNK